MKLNKEQISTLLTCCQYSIRNISDWHDNHNMQQAGEPKNSFKEDSLQPVREAMEVLRAMKKELK
jgi:hypothetical protein